MTHPVVDVIRLCVGVGAILLAALVFRLAWQQRSHGWDEGKPHPLTYYSFALALLLLAFLRIGHIGQEATWDLWVAVAVVVLGWVGVGARVKFNAKRGNSEQGA